MRRSGRGGGWATRDEHSASTQQPSRSPITAKGASPPTRENSAHYRVSANTRPLPFVPSHLGSNPSCWTSTCAESSHEPGMESTSHHPT